MNGILIVKCKNCNIQKFIYISEDSNVEDENIESKIADALDNAKKISGKADIEFIDTRGVDFFVCSCGNYSSVEELKNLTKIN